MIYAIVHWDHKPNPSADLLRYMYQQFDYVSRAFQVDELIFVDLHGTLKELAPPEVITASLDEALICAPQTYPIIHLAKDSSVLLCEIDWPDDCIIVVGPDYGTCSMSARTHPLAGVFSTVQIHMPGDEMELWASQALTIALANIHGC